MCQNDALRVSPSIGRACDQSNASIAHQSKIIDLETIEKCSIKEAWDICSILIGLNILLKCKLFPMLSITCFDHISKIYSLLLLNYHLLRCYLLELVITKYFPRKNTQPPASRPYRVPHLQFFFFLQVLSRMAHGDCVD
jgi:hypothetical protein